MKEIKYGVIPIVLQSAAKQILNIKMTNADRPTKEQIEHIENMRHFVG